MISTSLYLPSLLSLSRRTALLLPLAVAIVQPVTASNLYKWSDKQNQVHYGDVVPSEYFQAGYAEINEFGIVRKVVEPIKTAEQLDEIERQQNLAEKQRREAAVRAAYNRALLASYATEKDLIRSRDEKIEAFDRVIGIARDQLEDLEKRLPQMRNMAAAMERDGDGVPNWLRTDIKNINHKIIQMRDYIARQREDQEAIKGKYAFDLKRFREAKLEAAALQAGTEQGAQQRSKR
ncbi:MAG: DUF4124 domain-containing protein [Gammaproteobacteria bacterium]|nr:DUF4124 domain-containing protein [Gammaproteobacteria bacterium]